MDLDLFLRGEEFSAYEFFGGHLTRTGARFSVYAPGAVKVSVLGTFSDWEPVPMIRSRDRKSFRLTVKGASEGNCYMYRITGKNGEIVDHTDPYAFGMELRPDAAAVIRPLGRFRWHDAGWMVHRTACLDRPMNIYELHPGSWKKKGQGLTDWYSYRELAPVLIPYLKAHHFTHVEFTPLTEYPSDESWGYQTTGFFAPTARYGTPDDLRFLIDSLHKAGIGAILDFVNVHFAIDRYALANFDGTPLYEESRDGHSYSEWGSFNFDFTRPAVLSFLKSAAHYWLREFHFDGLRLDAVSNLVYPRGDSSKGENEA
ncbi:MAG: glycogen-branching enzyme, partial [Lachnospiraceae bacterium]|nr:glycogen-branching enzyme [Lachnospiraceae bacterium]